MTSLGTVIGNDIASASESEWAERSEHWIAAASGTAARRKLRERRSEPLILCGHGVSLRVEDGSLIVRDGFTHYPQGQSAHPFFPGSRDIPERILLLDGSGTLSFDVLSWLAEQGVALARVKWTGEVATVASGTGFASDAAKVQWQNDTRSNEAERVAFAVDLIQRKLMYSADTLAQCLPTTPSRDAAILRHRVEAEALARGPFASVDPIRAIEGKCAATYFAAWQGLTMNWTGRRPVPDEWRTYRFRSSLANGSNRKNYNASDPVNAVLNYAYAVKLAHMQIQTIADGYDPTIGIMHHGGRGKPAFIFDLIEPERPKVDAAVLTFVQGRSFAAADFVLRSDGVCRLSPQLARVVAAIVSTGNGNTPLRQSSP